MRRGVYPILGLERRRIDGTSANERKKTMKTILKIAGGAVLAAGLAVEPAMAAGLSANGQVVTNYVFRGITLSANRPAVQGGLDYDTGAGFTVGTWVSNVDFGDSSRFEMDVYGAYNFKLGGVNTSAGVYAYTYPYSGAAGPYTVVELTGAASYDFGFASWTGKANFSPWEPAVGFLDIRGAHPDSEYFLQTGVAVPVAPWLSLSGNIGTQGYGGAGTTNYAVWDLGATVTIDKYSLDLRYIDTSVHIPKAAYAAFATGPFFVATFKFVFP